MCLFSLWFLWQEWRLNISFHFQICELLTYSSLYTDRIQSSSTIMIKTLKWLSITSYTPKVFYNLHHITLLKKQRHRYTYIFISCMTRIVISLSIGNLPYCLLPWYYLFHKWRSNTNDFEINIKLYNQFWGWRKKYIKLLHP